METKPDEPISRIEHHSPGLTKREYMATHIAAGLVVDDGIMNPMLVAVSLADQLIRELNVDKEE